MRPPLSYYIRYATSEEASQEEWTLVRRPIHSLTPVPFFKVHLSTKACPAVKAYPSPGKYVVYTLRKCVPLKDIYPRKSIYLQKACTLGRYILGRSMYPRKVYTSRKRVPFEGVNLGEAYTLGRCITTRTKHIPLKGIT